ncbi:hypothetical protein TRL7639_01239 [Falsiruegeria litorea R37]|uniref:DUF5666 domain-containing protein n=1 Tax=Falsiruegeria litorea R37 TaxID=1200284 RepID=A0A1Y5S2K3_9RHOB|nr:DUF5666 domain-containing protein [Falsiruegeria litorea]SLN30207.1 hypothetical protein TRL7639_01239 [Falsiruegeria litorea R37]
MNLRTLLIGLFLATSLPALAQEDEDREGGIIGTGIVGTITELGSIIVNGQRIIFDGDMPVAGSVPEMTAKDLTPGLTVAVVATPNGDDWQARDIRQILPLVGPVTSVALDHLVVLGTKVIIGTSEHDLNTGDWVAVSGLWRGQDVAASSFARLPHTSKIARISGTFLTTDAQGRAVIGNTPITSITPTHLSTGDLVRVEGIPIGNTIQALRLETGLFDQPVSLVQIEGYYSPPQPDGLYTVLGSGLVAYTEMPEMISQTDRVVACGADGALGVDGEPHLSAQTDLGLDCRP